MPLNKNTNIKLKLTTKSLNSTLSFTGLAVQQELIVNTSQPSYGNITIADSKIIKSNTTSISTSRANTGTSSETTTTNINSIIPYNKIVAIATVAISADTGFKIAKKPKISIKSNNKDTKLFLQETSTIGTFNINCISSSSNNRGFEAELIYPLTKTLTLTNKIHRVSIDSTTVEQSGDANYIKIYGEPFAPFNLFLLDSDDNSVLKDVTSTGNILPGVRNCISDKLNKFGYFRHRPKFPRIKTVLSTTVTPAVTNQTRVVFSSLTGVQVGDELVTSGLKTVKVLTLNPTGSNANQCDLSSAVTFADNASASFRRSTTFKAHVTTTGTFKSTVNQEYPTLTLNQYLNPLLKITATTSNVSTEINGGSAGADDIQCFSGRPNKSPSAYQGASIYNLTYTLTGRTYTLKPAGLSNDSFTTNSGDTVFSITSIASTGTGTSTFKIFASIIIDKWGVEDTNITLNLDNIV